MSFFLNLTSKKIVKPKHIAHRIGRIMDGHRTESVAKTYAPCRYKVYLADEDWNRLEPFSASMVHDLREFIERHASKQGYLLLAEPEVFFEVKSDLEQGNYRVEPLFTEDARTVDQLNTMVFSKEDVKEIKQKPGSRHLRESCPVLEVVEGNDIGMKYDLTGIAITLGRREDNQVMINDPNVSRYHARIVHDKEWRIEDLKSTNGLFINGKQIKKGPLQPGDEIKVGSTLLKFRIE